MTRTLAAACLLLLSVLDAAAEAAAPPAPVTPAPVIQEGASPDTRRAALRRRRALRRAQRRAQLPPPPATTPADVDDGSASGGTDIDIQVVGNGAPGGVAGVTQITGHSPSQGAFYVWEVKLTPGTGFVEPFLIHTPSQYNVAPAPLVVFFHSFGHSHNELLTTPAVEEALRRGWYVVAPLGASKKHFASIPSQLNTSAVLDWVLSMPAFNIDRSRIYGLGFSMGGGAALNYAARHLDPAGPMLAAVVDHCGAVSSINVYLDDPGARYVFDFWHGDTTPGSADFWSMARSSVLNYEPVTLQVDGSWDLAGNLSHVPVNATRSSADPIPYLMVQADVLDAHLRALGVQVGPRYRYEILAAAGHTWSMLDFTAAFDWLAQHSLTLPAAAETLADHDGRYFHFDVEQDAGGAFTPFSWSVDAIANALVLVDTANLERVRVDTAAAGLDTGQPLAVRLGTGDGLPDVVVLRGYAQAPSAVLRDGSPTGSWSHDAATGTLALTELDGSTHDWLVQP